MMTRLLLLLTLLVTVLGLVVPVAAQAAPAPATKVVKEQPIKDGRLLASGYTIRKTISGTCYTSSDINPADFRCISGNGLYDPCWPYRSSAGAEQNALCPTSFSSHRLIRIVVHGHFPSSSSSSAARPWGYTLRNGRSCGETTGTHDAYHGQTVLFVCTGNAGLIGSPDKSHSSWLVREVLYRGGTLHLGPKAHVVRAYYAASFRAVRAAVPAQAPVSGGGGGGSESCHPLTNSGNCYEPGEFCRASDEGVHGVAGDGEAIVCEDNDGLRWEPA